MPNGADLRRVARALAIVAYVPAATLPIPIGIFAGLWAGNASAGLCAGSTALLVVVLVVTVEFGRFTRGQLAERARRELWEDAYAHRHEDAPAEP